MDYVPPNADPLLPSSDMPTRHGLDSSSSSNNNSSSRRPTSQEQKPRDEIWDQLNDHEALEVQQHQSRFSHKSPYTRTNPLVVLGSMVGTSVQQAASTTYQRAQDLLQQQQLQQQGNHNNANTNTNNMNEGLPYRQNVTTNHHQPSTYAPLATADGHDLSLNSNGRHPNNATGSYSNSQLLHKQNVATTDSQFIMGATALFQSTTSTYPRQQQQQQQQHSKAESSKSTFLKVSPFPNRPHNDGWGAVPNVDLFLSQIYKYYYHRGFVPIVCKGILELTTTIITYLLSILLLAYVDWTKVWQCHDEDTCQAHVQDYLLSWGAAPASSTSSSASVTFYRFIILPTYTMLFGVYTVFTIWQFWQTVQQALLARYVLEDKLGFASRKLLGGAIGWDEIVQKLVQVQENGTYRFMVNNNNNNNNNNGSNNTSPVHSPSTSMHQQHPGSPTRQPYENNDPTLSPSAIAAAETAASILRQQHQHQPPSPPQPTASTPPTLPSLDALGVAQRIMRKENFFLALWNNQLLDCTVGGRVYFGATLEWSCYFCILNYMFNHQYQIRPAFTQDPASLQQRFRLVAWLHIVFMPFVLSFQILHFILQNVYELQRNKTYLGHKDWSRAAKWTFREFNELPHVFDLRLEPSYKAAETYFGLFGSSEVMAAMGHLLVFVGGATGGVLLILAAMNDSLLLHVQYAGRNLVWYAGMAGVVYSVGKALSPTKKAPMVSHNLYQDMDAALIDVSLHTHFYPDAWKNRGWDSSIYGTVSKLMDSKVKLLLYELTSVILAPYILLYKWSPAAEQICDFSLSVRHKLPSPGAGDVCGYSTFDFDLYGDEVWDGRTMVSDNEARPEQEEIDLEASTLADSLLHSSGGGGPNNRSPMYRGTRDGSFQPPKARYGKMEKSFLNFQSAHPNWKCENPGGQSLLLRVEEYRQSEFAAALARERQLHITAAARQLETLAQLEQHRQLHRSAASLNNPGHVSMENSAVQLGTIFEGRGIVPSADAGAGIQPSSSSTASLSASMHPSTIYSQLFHGSHMSEASSAPRNAPLHQLSNLPPGLPLGRSYSSNANLRPLQPRNPGVASIVGSNQLRAPAPLNHPHSTFHQQASQHFNQMSELSGVSAAMLNSSNVVPSTAAVSMPNFVPAVRDDAVNANSFQGAISQEESSLKPPAIALTDSVRSPERGGGGGAQPTPQLLTNTTLSPVAAVPAATEVASLGSVSNSEQQLLPTTVSVTAQRRSSNPNMWLEQFQTRVEHQEREQKEYEERSAASRSSGSSPNASR